MENIRKRIKTNSRRLRQGQHCPDFFEFVRMIEKSRPDLPRLGFAKRPTQENVRFGQMPYLRFPATDIADIQEGVGDIDAVIITYFFGLLGVNGPMPLEFTNYVFQRSHNYYDQTWRRFLDVIHHRFLTFFYRAWATNEQSVSFDRPDDPITDIIKSFSGTPPDFKESEDRFTYLTADYASHFGTTLKTRSGLEEILRGVLKVKLCVQDFITSSYDIPQNYWCQLGKQDTATLGKNMQLGRQYLSSTREFEISFGIIDFADCQKLMPGSDGFYILTQTVSRYLDRSLEYTLKFKINGQTIPFATLSNHLSSHLGRNCWLGRKKNRAECIILTLKASRLTTKEHHASFKNKERIL